MRGLKFFGENNYRRGGLIAAYHNPRSINWRWLISYQWRFLEVWKMPTKWVMFNRMLHNLGGEAMLFLGPVVFRYAWQHPTWRKPARPGTPPQVPMPFPADFDADEGRCLICDGPLDTGWECNDCGADHYAGVKLLRAVENSMRN